MRRFDSNVIIKMKEQKNTNAKIVHFTALPEERFVVLEPHTIYDEDAITGHRRETLIELYDDHPIRYTGSLMNIIDW